MAALSPPSQVTEPFYPSSDGEPVAETFDRLYAFLTTLEVLKQQRAEQEREQREMVQEQAAELASVLARYRDCFGELPES
jgi:formyltetrahydrofolate hydrolase